MPKHTDPFLQAAVREQLARATRWTDTSTMSRALTTACRKAGRDDLMVKNSQYNYKEINGALASKVMTAMDDVVMRQIPHRRDRMWALATKAAEWGSRADQIEVWRAEAAEKIAVRTEGSTALVTVEGMEVGRFDVMGALFDFAAACEAAEDFAIVLRRRRYVRLAKEGVAT